MKRFFLLFILMIIAGFCHAQVTTHDTTKQPAEKDFFTPVERLPEYPGGISEFYKYLGSNIKYPTIARLIGINGKLHLSFIVERDGSVTNVTPQNCIGAGCEAEAVRLLEASPKWQPGMQKGKPVRVQYNVPITFSLDGGDGKVSIKNLRSSGYGFVFSIKDTLYTIDEAETILGKKFLSNQVQLAEPFYNYNKVEKFDMPDKKEIYLLIIKTP